MPEKEKGRYLVWIDVDNALTALWENGQPMKSCHIHNKVLRYRPFGKTILYWERTHPQRVVYLATFDSSQSSWQLAWNERKSWSQTKAASPLTTQTIEYKEKRKETQNETPHTNSLFDRCVLYENCLILIEQGCENCLILIVASSFR